MPADKLRVLYVGNSSYLSSGYSTYSFEVLSRLHATGEFELAELGQFGGFNDPRALDLPWRHYPVQPDPADADGCARYAANPAHEYGSLRLEEVALDFRPDVVMNVDDWWGSEFLYRSPLRRFFHLAVMPTCDAVPQMDQWVDSYRTADAVFTYTDWAADVLRGYGVDVLGSAPPGADVDTFKPVTSREGHRRSLGLPADILVVGTVNRNQPRKLYPDLVEAFAALRRTAPEGVRDRVYLYLHTAFPDQGWDIPRLVLDAGVGDRTLFTYQCRACRHAFPSLLADAKAVCPKCREHAAMMPDSSRGLSRTQLAAVFQTFDAYVSYATNEGLGMGQVEAAACGVPVFSVDYSAMSDVVRKVGGFPVKVQRFVKEAATGRLLAYPDNQDLVDQLVRHLTGPTVLKQKRERAAREGVLAHYTYDRTAKIWADHFRGLTPVRKWDEPPRFHTPAADAPPGLSDEEFVRWAFAAVLGRPDLAHSLPALRLTRDLTYGTTYGHVSGSVFSDAAAHGKTMFTRLQPFDRKHLIQLLTDEADRANYWEARRCKNLGGRA